MPRTVGSMMSRITCASSSGVTSGAGGVGAHAAGVGSAVAVVARLVVLRGRHRQDGFAVDDADETGFLAGQELLDHDAMTGFAEAIAGQHVVDRGVGLGAVGGDDHTLAGSEAVGLDHHRESEFAGVGLCRLDLGKALVARRSESRGARENPW